MTIQSYTMGPGLLTLGSGPLDVSCQVKSLKVECKENVKKTDPIPMLCGEDKTTADKVTREWSLSGKILQDLAAAGVVDYTWTNAGDDVAFAFVPSTAADRKVSGTVRLIPLTVGGDAGTDPDSDFTWMVPSDADAPVLADATP